MIVRMFVKLLMVVIPFNCWLEGYFEHPSGGREEQAVNVEESGGVKKKLEKWLQGVKEKFSLRLYLREKKHNFMEHVSRGLHEFFNELVKRMREEKKKIDIS